MDSLSAPSLSPSSGSQLSSDEMNLLAKLEEQNRLLEIDSKSLYPVNGVLHSPTSPKIPSPEDDIWGQVIRDWGDWSKTRVGQIKVLIRRGVPAHLRPQLWQLLCDAQNVAVRQQYSDLLKSSSPSETLIHRDLTRVFTQHRVFQKQSATCQEPLLNVLKAYSILDREIGYCQGSVFIVSLLLSQMDEEEAFCVLVRLMKDFRMRELYRSSTVELNCCIYQLDAMIQEQLPELHSHLQTQGFYTSMFSSSWFLNIFLSTLPLTAATRVFDIFMCEGLEIVFRVGLAALQMKQTELLKLDKEGMMDSLQFLESMESDPGRLIEAAYQIQYNPKRMKQLRKEFAAVKSKELEEQEELNGLYKENKCLKLSLDILEKRCSEKLVSQLEKELETARLNAAKSQNAMKEMQANVLQMKERCPVPDEDSVMYLQTELISCRLREADALTGFRELKHHIKDLEKKLQKQQVHCGGHQKVSSAQTELQVALLSSRLQETLTQAAIKESRHRLLQLQTENKMHSDQLTRAEAHVNSQREYLQELTSQNQDLRSQLQQFTAAQYKRNEEQHKEAENMTIITDLQQQITELQTQIQSISKSTTSFSQPAMKPSSSASLEHSVT